MRTAGGRGEPRGGPTFAGVEAGGTKFVCLIGSGPDDVVAEATLPTTSPRETLGRVVDFFRTSDLDGAELEALGVASFGPLDLERGSSEYGWITATPKLGWRGTDIRGVLRSALDVPTRIDTDVNGAAYGEFLWGAGRGTDSFVYLTVGTGVGGGCIMHGEPLRGLLHPEMGHIAVERHPADDYAGRCPFHGDCLEGLASGPALSERFGRATSELGDLRPRAVELEAWYVAQLVCAVTYLLSPRRIAIGGGVLRIPGLRRAVREESVRRLAGAIPAPVILEDAGSYIVEPGLGRLSGALGAVGLARQALLDETR